MTKSRFGTVLQAAAFVLGFILAGCAVPGDPAGEADETQETQQAIVNGTVATSDSIGIVYLELWDPLQPNIVSSCSGTLLTNRWVLTAKHCVLDSNGVPLSDPSSEIWVYHVLNVNTGNPPYIPADALLVHPTADVALIRLSSTFSGTSSITNVLGLQNAGDLNGKKVTCYGYGIDTHRTSDQKKWGAAGILRYANTQKVTSDDGTTMLLDAVTQGEWHGDSGGPCFYTNGSYRYLVMTFSNWNYINDWDPLNASGPSAVAFRDWVWYWMFTADTALAGGSGFTFGPGIAAPDSNHLQVVAPGGDNAMWEDIWNGTSWAGWRSLSGKFTSAAAASRLSSNTSLVFARGTDNAIWYASAKTDGTSGAWTSLGGVLLGAPAAVNTNDGYTYVFARGTDSKLYYRRYNGSTWTAWAAIAGGQLLGSDPSAASMAKGWAHVFSLAQNGSLQYTWLQPGKSWQWNNLGASYANPPAATSSGPNQLDLFIRGATDNQIYYRKYYGAWAPYWTNLDYVTSSNPAVVSRATGLIDLVFRGSSNEMRYAASGY